MRLQKFLNESKINVEFIKKHIQKAVKEDPKRLTHGDTGKTAFWILPSGKILPHSKGFKEAYKVGNVISVHSHSPVNANDPRFKNIPFDTFSGEDLRTLDHMLKYGFGDTSVVISINGYMDILKGGNWKKKDFKYDKFTGREIEKLELEYGKDWRVKLLTDLAKERGATYKRKKRWK